MTKKTDVSKGDEVEWKWGQGKGTGEVTKVHTNDVQKEIKGNEVKRKASKSSRPSRWRRTRARRSSSRALR